MTRLQLDDGRRVTRLPPVIYITMDSRAEGVGASQVLPYVERLSARGLHVSLHSFEKSAPDPGTAARLRHVDVEWRPHDFGSPGARAGLGRVLRAARVLRGAELVHARSDLAAGAAMLAGARRWLWDVRSFFADQRIALGDLRQGSPEERVLRLIERRAAHSSAGVITLSAAAIPVLTERYGLDMARKTRVVTTCTDLDRFAPSSLPQAGPVRFLLSGTLNRYYDVPAMIRMVEAFDRRERAEITVLAPADTSWRVLLEAAGATLGSATAEDMPEQVSRHHVGLCVCRFDAGVSLKAAMPTKLGEFLACGRPVVVNDGLGDIGQLVTDYRCGVVLKDGSDVAIASAAEELHQLLMDPGLPQRCRDLAEDRFNLDKAVDQLLTAYRAAIES